MNSYRVLIVDDQELERDLMKHDLLLSQTGDLNKETFEVREASSAFEAEKILGEFKPDLIVLDLLMPGKNGIDFCREIKSRPETRQTPVLTRSVAGLMLSDAREAGAMDFLPKPCPPGAFREKVMAIQRNYHTQESEVSLPHILTSDPIRLDLNLKAVTRGGRQVDIGPLEFTLLRLFIERKGEPVSWEDIHRALWNSPLLTDDPKQTDAHKQNVFNVIHRLRESLGGLGKRIELFGNGYRYMEEK